ncbi:unnamed protein product (macronuclear) [Paramecium tetraurelia]|uniref:ELMO domain-containing protein n=1 Tax=Paramecium tetraurelia TaxID=5888 RepID=A0DRW5_PARTE|nr:uncharacterized protein GSPATT00019486001 [Paramecium tetraurelia]CAK85782.1 unnamed protein product [Paramecium tetraurelia]|eukprot:XP_001453179.1 hypothetical protein (macronuclear) [Paramecium tetraurelia strain d4-2]
MYAAMQSAQVSKFLQNEVSSKLFLRFRLGYYNHLFYYMIGIPSRASPHNCSSFQRFSSLNAQEEWQRYLKHFNILTLWQNIHTASQNQKLYDFWKQGYDGNALGTLIATLIRISITCESRTCYRHFLTSLPKQVYEPLGASPFKALTVKANQIQGDG